MSKLIAKEMTALSFLSNIPDACKRANNTVKKTSNGRNKSKTPALAIHASGACGIVLPYELAGSSFVIYFMNIMIPIMRMILAIAALSQ